MIDHATSGYAHLLDEPDPATVTRAQIAALAARLDDRLRALPSHLPTDATPDALEAALRVLRRVDDVLDTVILAARRRDE